MKQIKKDKKLVDQISQKVKPIKPSDMTSLKALKSLNQKMNKEYNEFLYKEAKQERKKEIDEKTYDWLEEAKEGIIQEMIKRELARKSFKHFVEYVKPDFTFSEFNLDLIDKLQQAYEGKIEYMIVNMPPRHGKTLLVNILFPAFVLGNRPYEEFMNVGYAVSLAAKTSRETLAIVKSERFTNIFPDFKLDETKQSQNEWCVVDNKHGNNGVYYGAGVGGGQTGRGFTYGIVDDPYSNREDADSAVIQQKVIDWYTSTFSTRYNPHKDSYRGHKGCIILIMTRWNVNDLIGFIDDIESGKKSKWTKIIYKAIEDDGRILFPEKFSLQDYTAQKELNIRDFEALYQQNPIASMGAIFEKANFKYFLSSDIDKEGVYAKDNFIWGMFIDPAWSSSKTSDDIVAMIVGKNKTTNEYFVLDIVGGKIAPSEAFVKIGMALDYWKARGLRIRFISIEQVSINKDQSLFKANLLDYLRKNDKIYSIYDYCPRENKQDRIKWTLEPRFQNSLIHFINKTEAGRSEGFKILEEELLKFPGMKHDDYPDALTQACIMLDEKSGIEVTRDTNMKTNTQERYYIDPLTHEKVAY